MNCCYIILLAVVAVVAAEEKDAKTAKVTHKAFFDIKIGGKDLGRIEFGLFGDVLPKTVKNFYDLSTHKWGYGYKETIFHRVLKGFMIQAGDYTTKDGSGDKSIYGKMFKDEGYPIKHNIPGLLSMANEGPDNNGSQFFITLVKTPWLDGKHVVFGKVLDGMDIVRKIEEAEVNESGWPKKDVQIKDCGGSKVKEPFEVDVGGIAEPPKDL